MSRIIRAAQSILDVRNWSLVRFVSSAGQARQARIRASHRRRHRPAGCPPWCVTIPAAVYRRPDPLIYSQHYLSKLGLTFTWDNPDIQLFWNGQAVPSSQLKESTAYQIVATIYNGSPYAPAVKMPVHFSFLSFGIGTEKHTIGSDTVTVPPKGALGHPTQAKVEWITPAEPGHYCIQVQFSWPDDANPENNLGQENVHVGVSQSPVSIPFPVRNDQGWTRTLRFVADAYMIPEQPRCSEYEGTGARARLLDRHKRSQYALPTGWSAALEPAEVTLRPNQSETVIGTITPPSGFSGRQAINVHAYDGQSLVGGVTFYIDGS